MSALTASVVKVPSDWEMALMRVWQEQYLRQSDGEFEKWVWGPSRDRAIQRKGPVGENPHSIHTETSAEIQESLLNREPQVRAQKLTLSQKIRI